MPDPRPDAVGSQSSSRHTREDELGRYRMSSRPLLEIGESRRSLASLYEIIAADLAAAEVVFQKELGSRFPFVQHLVDHCGDFRGKRLRPALVLFSGRASGTVTDDHAVLAAVVEMIHTATLVHDDVLDEAVIRRHAATVNAEWGNETAVLLGDYLFTHAFHLAASLESTLACRWIGAATNRVCEGEMQQVHHRGNLDLEERDYFEIIEGKTAELTAVSCRLGAYLRRARRSRSWPHSTAMAATWASHSRSPTTCWTSGVKNGPPARAWEPTWKSKN